MTALQQISMVLRVLETVRDGNPPHGAALQKNSHLDLILLPLISQHIYCPLVGIIYFNPISFSFLIVSPDSLRTISANATAIL